MEGTTARPRPVEELRRIALRTHAMARLLARVVAGAEGRDPRAASFSTPVHSAWFDTVCFDAGGQVERIVERAAARQINLRPLPGGRIAVAFDETVGLGDVADVACALTGVRPDSDELRELAAAMPVESDVLTASLVRDDPVLTHPVFNRYHSETDFVRYLKKLENRDISLVHSMIPLGSCTMKLNAASEMAPISWPSFRRLKKPWRKPRSHTYSQGFSRPRTDI